jgi:hypothetical protein
MWQDREKRSMSKPKPKRDRIEVREERCQKLRSRKRPRLSSLMKMDLSDFGEKLNQKNMRRNIIHKL